MADRDVAQARVRIRRETIATLTEWQVHALRAGAQKPTYGELIDVLVASARNASVDPVSDLVANGVL
jgi:hypothetical protein